MIDAACCAAPLRFLRRPEVSRLTGIQRTTVYKLEAEGLFPKRVSLGGRAVAWIESEVIAWMTARVAARDGCAATA